MNVPSNSFFMLLRYLIGMIPDLLLLIRSE